MLYLETNVLGVYNAAYRFPSIQLLLSDFIFNCCNTNCFKGWQKEGWMLTVVIQNASSSAFPGLQGFALL